MNPMFASSPERAWQRRMLAGVIVVALAIGGLLAWQVRLAERLYAAEAEQAVERARLAAARVGEDLQREMADLAGAFAGAYEPGDLAVPLETRRAAWQARAAHPSLLTHVCLIDRAVGGEVTPRCLTPEGRLATQAWPASLRAWRTFFLQGGPVVVQRGSELSTPAALAPALVVRLVDFDGTMPGITLVGGVTILLGLDRAALTGALPSDLLNRYLDAETRARIALTVQPARSDSSGAEVRVPFLHFNSLGDAIALRSGGAQRVVLESPRPLRVTVGGRPAGVSAEPTLEAVIRLRAGAADPAARVRRATLVVGACVAALVLGVLGLLYAAARRIHALAQDRLAFVASVSHELRTPVATVMGVATNLRDGLVTEPDRVVAYGVVLYEEARRLRRMVEATLDLASGALPPVPVAVNLSTLVTAAVARAHRSHLDVPVEVEVPVEPVVVEGDADALERSILNLVENAFKYGAGTPVAVRVTHGAAMVRVEVEDGGIGLTDEEAGHVFEPFYRSERARAVASGSGIGLALVRRTAEAHGGTIAVQRMARGTRFVLELPAQALHA